MCSKASTEEFENNSKASIELLNSEESDYGGTDSGKSTNPGKMISKKSRISEEMVEMADDEDVAVPCNQCHKIFNNSKALTRHQRTSHIPDDKKCICPVICIPICARFTFHIKNKHSNDNESTEKNINKSTEDTNVTSTSGKLSKPSKPKRYEVRSLCSVCGSSFSSKTHLIVHIRRHTGERPFKSDLCDRAYPRISELTCHRRIHTGGKPFACKICGKTFKVSSKMTTHIRSHTDIRPYKCTQFDTSFKYSKDLSIHIRIQTGERPYICNVCGRTFTQSNTLKAHRVKLGHMENANH